MSGQAKVYPERAAGRLCTVFVLAVLLLVGLWGGLLAGKRAYAGQPLDVVIHEVAWMGTQYSDWDEWVELYNATSSPVVLEGWTLTSTGSVYVDLSGTIPARGFFLLERDDRAVSDLQADQVYGGQHIGNLGEILVLRDETGQTVDTANVELGHDGGWAAGTNDPECSMERIDPAASDANDNWATNNGSQQNGFDGGGVPICGTPRAENSVSVRPASSVWIYALHPYALRSADEAIALINPNADPVALDGWGIADGGDAPDALLPAIDLPPGSVVWLADDADAFLASFGFAPGAAMRTVTCSVPLMSGSWPGFANTGDEAILFDPNGAAVDALVYGDSTALLNGWLGDPVTYPLAGFGSRGQVLRRKLDEQLGRPLTDTHRAVDWANAAVPGAALYGPVHEGDLFGKRVTYPGWEWDVYTRTLAVEATAFLTVGIAPDNAFSVLSAFLSQAQDEILIEGYTLESVWLTGVLTERLAAGIAVEILLEGGDVSSQELWCCQQIADAGGDVRFMHNDVSRSIDDRYRNQHSKFLIVDRSSVAVSTENLSNRSLPLDDKSNGTAGHRGVVLVTEQQEVVDHIVGLLERDNDPLYHSDIVSYGTLDRYTVPVTFTPFFSTGGGAFVYMAPFSTTVGPFVADAFEVLHAPETSLRYSDGLMGLVLQAGEGDEVLVEQMYERLHWGPSASTVVSNPNPRLEAYIQAARQGASVRILLDSRYDDQRQNLETALYVQAVSDAEGLDLQVRLGNPTLGGIHNKMVLVRLGTDRYVHVGSLNGSEVSSKANRELALQARSDGAHQYLEQVWHYDWAHSRGPHQVYLPLAFRRYVAESDHVLVSEIMFKQAGSGDEMGEWIELYNPTAFPVDLSGWRLGDAVHAGDYERLYAFPAGATIVPYGTVVVARRAQAYQALAYASKPVPDYEWNNSTGVPNMIATNWGEGECALGNTGDEVLLYDAEGRLVDALAYGSGRVAGVVPWLDVSAVYNEDSLERRPANRDSDDCSFDFSVRYEPAPGTVEVW